MSPWRVLSPPPRRSACGRGCCCPRRSCAVPGAYIVSPAPGMEKVVSLGRLYWVWSEGDITPYPDISVLKVVPLGRDCVGFSVEVSAPRFRPWGKPLGEP